MSTSSRNTWRSGWTAERPPQIRCISVHANEGTWQLDERRQFEYRDLRLAEVSEGMLGAMHIRAAGAGGANANGWRCHDLDLEFFYVLKGSMKIETQDGNHYRLGECAAGIHPPLYWYCGYDVSEDFECIRITAPAQAEIFFDRESALPEHAASLDPERQPVYRFDTPDAYTMDAGPQSSFKYRDFGTAAMTDGRIKVQIIRATEPGAGRGWHYHSMAQWSVILGGWAYKRFEDLPKQKIGYLDSSSCGPGPTMRHNIGPYSGDYAVLQMCIPAEYDTTAVLPPEDADTPPEGAIE